MGREVRRVVLGFDWPLRQTWWGYLLGPIPCRSCIDGKNESAEYGYCPVCEGEKQVYPQVNPPAIPLDACRQSWQETHYPGWQMWETTSEGSPISPVLESPEQLAHWLADNKASAFGSQTATYDEWLSMLGVGSSVSAIYTPETGLISGVSAAKKLS